ncbi:Hermansky-Pudlak syndrome 4 protein isoform X2 [Nannospalax galili]|uniref:Hermansky-Pudlak syndrome 4 protein isoform X2 n=1 Tax=Nannospalax galili TaxID=1026970 RepID=UPI00111C6637|nr:Hermansky-Pudlak syndrome 4 protein isoform X2 [Nannospalax galili]
MNRVSAGMLACSCSKARSFLSWLSLIPAMGFRLPGIPQQYFLPALNCLHLLLQLTHHSHRPPLHCPLRPCQQALGCAVELSDVSCRRFLDQLIGFFHFYNGPVSLAYKSYSLETLSLQWDTFITQVLRHTSELHRVFSALWSLDRSKVEPLLLLKAALILQTCQRTPHILAGCILYKGLIVSTQLPPSLTAKVLLQTACQDQRLPAAGDTPQGRGATLPSNVQIIPVFLSEEEAANLHEFPVEWRRMRFQYSSSQYPPQGRNTSILAENVTRHMTSAAWTSAATLEPTPTDGAWLNGRGENGHLPGHEQKWVESTGLCTTAWGQGSGCSSQLQNLGFPQGELDLSETHIPEAQEAFPAVCAPDCKGPYYEEAVLASHWTPSLPVDTAVGNCLAPSSLKRLPERGALEQDVDLPSTSGQAQESGVDPLPRRGSRSGPLPPPGIWSRKCELLEGGGGHGSDTVPTLAHAFHSADSRVPSPSADGSDSEPALAGLVRMNLYTHSVKGLVLSLLAEEPLLGDATAIEEVYHSSLASLNGLEVHLKETLPRDEPGPAGSSYNFVHYDRIQSVLTANQPPMAAPQDRRFLQAVSLVHSDFAQLPTLYEMTIRNASTAVYACCNPAQETYFQQLVPTARSSGFPNPEDCAFSLAGKAKHKLLRHGVNLL